MISKILCNIVFRERRPTGQPFASRRVVGAVKPETSAVESENEAVRSENEAVNLGYAAVNSGCTAVTHSWEANPPLVKLQK